MGMYVQSCPTLCSPMDHSPPGSSVHRIFQARILEWVAITYTRGLVGWGKDQSVVGAGGVVRADFLTVERRNTWRMLLAWS